MTNIAKMTAGVREIIIAEPEVILEDADVMRALINANEKALGSNIVDLRGIAMERLERRLDRLEDTHRSVIAAAYENLAGTNQVHRAILRLLEPTEFADFLGTLGSDVAEILRVDCTRLVLESDNDDGSVAMQGLGDVVAVAEPGFIQDYLTHGRDVPLRPVTLRQVSSDGNGLYGPRGIYVRSEACIRVDLGDGRMPAMLAFGAEDPHHFAPTQGSDLLTFFAGVFERAMRRWLA